MMTIFIYKKALISEPVEKNIFKMARWLIGTEEGLILKF